MEPKSPNGLRVGIVNPGTLVGTELKTILVDRKLPLWKVVLLDSTGAEAGRLTDLVDEPTVVTAVSDDELEDLDLVFFCGPAAQNAEWIGHAGELRFVAIDLSQPSTGEEEGRLAVAGVNLDELDREQVLLSPHPVAIPIALILHQIGLVSPVESCTATVIQPASAFDQAGVEELAQQTVSILSAQSFTKEVFDRQLAFNLYPAVDRREEAIVRQVKAMTSARADIALLVTQGTIFHSHTFSLFVKTRDAVTQDQLLATLGANAAIALPQEDESFGTIDAAGKDEVLISEVRMDPAVGHGFWVWAVCDNLRRSSALNAVLVAEKMLFGSGTTN